MEKDRKSTQDTSRYFEELLKRIRDIRTSERSASRKIADVIAVSAVDYQSTLFRRFSGYITLLRKQGATERFANSLLQYAEMSAGMHRSLSYKELEEFAHKFIFKNNSKYDNYDHPSYQGIPEKEKVTPISSASVDAEELPTKNVNVGNGFVADAKVIKECFNINNDFVREKVSALKANFYHGRHANLALIEITLFHHQQLKQRNSHKSFVMALAAWGILTITNNEEFKRIVMGISDKYKRLPKEGYLEWNDNYKTDRLTCERMGKKLGPTMKYME